MKSKIFIYLLLMAGSLQFFSSCKKSFLAVDPKGQFLESNYYQTADEAYTGLVAAYNPVAWEFVTDYLNKLSVTNSLGDECYAGGGGKSDINEMQVCNNYTLYSAVGPQQDMWNRSYTGIYRCNLLLQKMAGTISGLTPALQTRYIAEAKCLRAYYYFDLMRFFKNVPLITVPLTSSDFYTVLQAKPADVYTQIEKDFNDAIPNLPQVVTAGENGRITKGAAMAMLGKAILYQNNTARMQEAASWFEKVNTSGVYQLQASFAGIFDPANKFNSESVFEVTHYFNVGNDWSNLNGVTGNIYVNMIGPRSYSGPTIFSAGWSFSPIIATFQQFMHGDPRYQYTVLDIDSLTKATGSTYFPGYANTGFFIGKYAPLAKYASTTGVQALNFPNDYIEIRLADVYLMEAEALVRGGGNAGSAQSYLDKVRARVGLASIPATLDNIYNERRLELATEGHRWFDLVRTGQAGAALKFKGFTTGKNEVLPIPLNELNNTKLVQNPGYN